MTVCTRGQMTIRAALLAVVVSVGMTEGLQVTTPSWVRTSSCCMHRDMHACARRACTPLYMAVLKRALFVIPNTVMQRWCGGAHEHKIAFSGTNLACCPANEAAHARRRAVDVARRTPRSRPRGSFALTRARASASCSWPRQRALHRPRDGQCTSASSQTSTPRPTAPCDSRPSLRQCPPVACGASARVR